MGVKFHHDHPAIAIVTLADENLTTIMTFNSDFVASMEAVSLEIANAGNVLDQFQVHGQVVSGGAFVPIADVAADFVEATLAPMIRKARPALASLADATTGILIVDTRGLFGLRVQAARATGANTILTMKAGGD